MPLPYSQQPQQNTAESYQSGPYCYASVQAAANAACAAHVPVTTLTPDAIRHASCAGITTDGALVLNVSESPLDGSQMSYMQVEAPQWFMPCQERAKWDAYMIVVGALLTLAAISYGFWKVYQTINNNSRNQE